MALLRVCQGDAAKVVAHVPFARSRLPLYCKRRFDSIRVGARCREWESRFPKERRLEGLRWEHLAVAFYGRSLGKLLVSELFFNSAPRNLAAHPVLSSRRGGVSSMCSHALGKAAGVYSEPSNGRTDRIHGMSSDMSPLRNRPELFLPAHCSRA